MKLQTLLFALFVSTAIGQDDEGTCVNYSMKEAKCLEYRKAIDGP